MPGAGEDEQEKPERCEVWFHETRIASGWGGGKGLMLGMEPLSSASESGLNDSSKVACFKVDRVLAHDGPWIAPLSNLQKNSRQSDTL